MAFSASPFIKYYQTDANGDPLVGGKLYSYVAESLDPQATYTTANGDVENTNPVILDGSGRASVFLDDSLTYYFELYDSDDNLIWTEDNITSGSGDGGLPVFTTGDQEISGIKIFHDTAAFGPGDVAEYEVSGMPLVVGGQDSIDTGIQIVGNGVLAIQMGDLEQGSDSNRAGIAYDLNSQELSLRRDSEVAALFTDTTVEFEAAGASVAGVALVKATDVIAIEQGGTGEVTVSAAINALLPDQATHAGESLTTDGTNVSWTAGVNGPQFLAAPYTVFTGTTQPSWTTYDSTVAGVPDGATALIMEAFGGRNTHDTQTINYACLRVDATKGNVAGQPQQDTFVLMACGVDQGRFTAVWGSMGNTYPVRVDRTFDYIVQDTWEAILTIRIIGYYL